MFILGMIIGLYLAYVFLEKRPNKNKYITYGIGAIIGGLVGKYLSLIISTLIFIVIMIVLGLVGLVLIKKFLK